MGATSTGLGLPPIWSEVHGLYITNFKGSAVFISSANNTIGGTAAGQHNVLSGNDTGVYISGGVSNIVQSNLIGVSPDGMTKVPNYYGVYIINGAYNNTIGGDTAARGITSRPTTTAESLSKGQAPTATF